MKNNNWDSHGDGIKMDLNSKVRKKIWADVIIAISDSQKRFY